MHRTERLEFTGSQGDTLAARFDRPLGPVRATALFAHCFTCGKDIAAASRIARALADQGVAVLRFDFTGLGHSDGEFANTNFSSNVEDLVLAAAYLREVAEAPALLIGHSLGGAAVLAAASDIPEAKAVITIGAPADPEHVAEQLRPARDVIERDGQAEVELGGRRFTIRRQLLEDLAAQRLEPTIAALGRPLLILHSPSDEVVGLDNASQIFAAAQHPKSFISLDGTDHLLSRGEDATWVAGVIGAWAERHLPQRPASDAPEVEQGVVLVQETGDGRYMQEIVAGPHHLRADEPKSLGGDDTGPSPYDLLLAGLGACTSITMRMYADRKKWALEHVRVLLVQEKIHAKDCEECETETGKIDRIARVIRIEGDLDDDQRARLMEIADRCPVHRTLHSEVLVETRAE